jgi:hypothetical protein
MAEVDGVQIDHDRRHQVKTGDPVMLPLGGVVTDFTLANNA